MGTIVRALTVAALALSAVTGPATAAPPPEVDQTRLVPTTLDSSFAPFDCKTKQTGPVCTGERHDVYPWALTDWPCAVPVYASRTDDRWQTRYYNTDYLNYDRTFRIHDVDRLGTSSDGEVTATVETHARFREPFAVPGDDTTFTIITTGTIWDVKPVDGPAVSRAVGTLVEPPDAGATFTGHVTIDGVTTRYDDAPLESFFSDEKFVGWICRAVTGG